MKLIMQDAGFLLTLHRTVVACGLLLSLSGESDTENVAVDIIANEIDKVPNGLSRNKSTFNAFKITN
jgi:hypothetical protein